jgi:hypothetical protein
MLAIGETPLSVQTGKVVSLFGDNKAVAPQLGIERLQTEVPGGIVRTFDQYQASKQTAELLTGKVVPAGLAKLQISSLGVTTISRPELIADRIADVQFRPQGSTKFSSINRFLAGGNEVALSPGELKVTHKGAYRNDDVTVRLADDPKPSTAMMLPQRMSLSPLELAPHETRQLDGAIAYNESGVPRLASWLQLTNDGVGLRVLRQHSSTNIFTDVGLVRPEGGSFLWNGAKIPVQRPFSLSGAGILEHADQDGRRPLLLRATDGKLYGITDQDALTRLRDGVMWA